MRDRVSTHVLQNGAMRYGVYDAAGNLLRYEYIRPEDEPVETGMQPLKENYLTDETAAKVWPVDTPNNPTVSEAMDKLKEPQYRIGDMLTTVRYLDSTWLLCDGSTISQADYPELYAITGGTLPSLSYSDDTGTYIKALKD